MNQEEKSRDFYNKLKQYDSCPNCKDKKYAIILSCPMCGKIFCHACSISGNCPNCGHDPIFNMHFVKVGVLKGYTYDLYLEDIIENEKFLDKF
jgi:hypothetical protein